jgi:Flp pilus assembly protein TadB
MITMLLGLCGLGWLWLVILMLQLYGRSHQSQKDASAGPSYIQWLHWFSTWPWWSEPGWWVRITQRAAVSSALDLLNIPLNPEQYLRLRQWWWSSLVAVFLAFVWLGKASWEEMLLVWGGVIWLSFLPEMFLSLLLRRRRKQLSREMPYFLDVLTLSLESGQNLQQALVMTTEHFTGPLAELLRKKLQRLEWGQSLETVLTELKPLLRSDDFSHFVESLLRSKHLGVSLSQTLVVQTQLLRTQRRQRAEEMSRTAAVKISVPLVLFIFPALLLIYIGPGVLQLLNHT